MFSEHQPARTPSFLPTVAGTIRCLPEEKKGGFARIVQLDLESATVEDYLRCVDNLTLSLGNEFPRVVAFAGMDFGASSSRFSAHFAIALAGRRLNTICLVDAYPHAPSLAEILGVGMPCGLRDSLQMGGAIGNFVIPTRVKNLWLLSWESLGAKTSALLSLQMLASRLRELRQQVGFVVLNAPPLGVSAEGIEFLRVAEGVIPVLEKRTGEAWLALEVAEQLRAAQIRVLGAVVL